MSGPLIGDTVFPCKSMILEKMKAHIQHLVLYPQLILQSRHPVTYDLGTRTAHLVNSWNYFRNQLNQVQLVLEAEPN